MGKKLSINDDDVPQAYARALTDAKTLDALRAAVAEYPNLAVDANRVVARMTEDDFTEFRRGLKLERKGRFAGEPWAQRFIAILMPQPMFKIAAIAEEYKAPFVVMYRRIQEVRPDLLVVK